MHLIAQIPLARGSPLASRTSAGLAILQGPSEQRAQHRASELHTEEGAIFPAAVDLQPPLDRLFDSGL
jgi:hypothetical protein